METFSSLLTLCAGNSPVTGEFPAQRPVTRSFDVFFDLRLNKRLSKQWWGWWFETPPRPLWRHCDDTMYNEEHVHHVFYIYTIPTYQNAIIVIYKHVHEHTDYNVYTLTTVYTHANIVVLLGQQISGPDSSNGYSIWHESEGWEFESPAGRSIFYLKNFDTFTRISDCESKMNAVVRVQLTFQILTYYKECITLITESTNCCFDKQGTWW